MARNSETNGRIREERRSQILLSALKIFTKKGLAAARMSDISADTGISYGLIYHYFRSKEEIYTQLIRHAVDSLGNVVEEIREEEVEPIEQIRKIAVRVLGSVEKKDASGYYYVLIMNALTCEAVPVPASEIAGECMKRLKLLADIIAEGQKKGQIRAGDSMELAVTCFSAVIGLALMKVSGSIRKLPDPEILIRLF